MTGISAVEMDSQTEKVGLPGFSNQSYFGTDLDINDFVDRFEILNNGGRI